MTSTPGAGSGRGATDGHLKRARTDARLKRD